MGKQRTPAQLAQIQDFKDKTLAWLDHEAAPRTVQQIRDHLGITTLEQGRALETALKEAREVDRRAEQVQGRRGVWRSVKPGQQPLPVPPAAPGPDLAALSGLQADTVAALKARLGAVLVASDAKTAQWLGRVLTEAGMLAAGSCDQFKGRFLEIAAIALRAYEATP